MIANLPFTLNISSALKYSQLDIYFSIKVMKDPKILLTRIWVIFDIICFLLALITTLKNIGRYNEDASETTVSYKKYGNTVEDKYPSFSVCFKGNGLYIFNESAIFTAYGIHPRDYEKMIHGEGAFQYEYDPSIRRYSKTALDPKYKPNVEFEGYDLFQLYPSLEIVKDAKFVVVVEHQKRTFLGNVYGEQPFYISYQASNLVCLTRNQSYTLDYIRNYDTVMFKFPPLPPNKVFKLTTFIHYPGQLLRSFDTPRYETTLKKFLKRAVYFKLSQTTVLRKRTVQSNPCNENIGDHDLHSIESIINDTGCVPPYWRNIIGTSSSLMECSSPEQFKEVYDLTKDYKKALKDREDPCVDMFNSVVSKVQTDHKDFENCETCIYFEIAYLEKYYEEIKEIKDFEFQDFISNIGGFIGIFLGYSMMQIPQLLGMTTAS